MVGAPLVTTKRQTTGKPSKVEKCLKPSVEDFPDIEVVPNTIAAGRICETLP